MIGRSVWTKLIRNQTAVQYLENVESYNFSYQFNSKLPEPIQLYPVNKQFDLKSNMKVFFLG